ncbi:CoA ester lyase [Duganella sp. BJB488]|uniref:HpcH/HpaI aldolase/citrate lyase family protein n=1 Tax=unclassified Duganella TaxID=2636909 RepID=UPI000E34AEBB|nr:MULTISPECIES: aldolase/citrate lyase family protein [unclassified Duganella]NVD71201.1 CoA ester lyase [Duganella sp. BJB1802]RFP09041.1 CoA ester lyase [Duganella sp. BJB489]RFP11830.1 CoA ester lyase [Duganella sp. BJB488]RFP29040.1 CoA ester lyase [Duganella sp. BJB480]
MHPSEVLFQGNRQPLLLPACDHYAGSEKLMRKSIALQQELGPLFDITLDCEDGASAGNEEAHARLVAELLLSDENKFNRIGARVHDVASPHFAQDVAIICAAAPRLAYLVLPKVHSAKEVAAAIKVINTHAAKAGRKDLPVHVLIETHGALREAYDIAALPQVQCLSFGIMDFVSSHYGAIPAGAMRTPGQFTHPLVVRAKLEIAAACHAHGKVPSHNVTTEIKDTAVAANDAQRAAAEFGYTRMWSIHPNQIKPIIKTFTPRLSEVSEAAAILLEAEAVQWGPISQNGRLHDRASYRYYWTVLQRAKLAGLSLPESAVALINGSPTDPTLETP